MLDIEGKTKDNVKSCLEVKRLGIGNDLHTLELTNGRLLLPSISYIITNKEKC